MRALRVAEKGFLRRIPERGITTKEIRAYSKLHPNSHLIIVEEDELAEIRHASKECHAHRPENNANRAIISASVSTAEAGIFRVEAARRGMTLSAWLRASAIDKTYLDELAEFKPADGITTEQRAGDILAYFLG